MSTSTDQPSSGISLTYKYLLTFSTLSAVFFCYLYVTKPITIIQGERVSSESTQALSLEKPEETSSGFDALNSDSLPGETSTTELSEVNPTSPDSTIPLAENDSTKGLIGFEETNHKVQHVLTAQNSNISERIILEVPVIYKTRGLRFGPEQVNEAQRVLRALKIYQSQIKKLHQDGTNIQSAWNELLLDAQPIGALRADSPSLPQTPKEHSDVLFENSSSTIKISK